MNQESKLLNRLDLSAVTWAIIFPSILTFVYFVLLESRDPFYQKLAYGIGKPIQFGFPLLWVWFAFRDFFQTDPLPGKLTSWNRYDWIGVGFGFAVVAAMMAIYFGMLDSSQIAKELVEKAKIKTVDVGIDTPFKFLGLGVFYALCHSFLEEYYWRWFVYGFLRRGFAGWRPSTLTAIAISSLGFMAHHVIVLVVYFGITSPLAYLFSMGVAVGGAFWAWLYTKSNSLRAPWVSHMIVDAGIFLLGYLILKPYLVG